MRDRRLVLETLSSVKEREIPVLAEILGYGMAMDTCGFRTSVWVVKVW